MVADSKARKILKSFPKDVVEYFVEIDRKCQKYGIKFKLGSGKSLNAGMGRCGGYFDDGQKVLAVAIGSGLYSALSICVHEASHMKQWKSPKSIWKNRKVYNGYNRFYCYLDGKKIYKLKTAVDAAISLELEAERMAVREIKKRWTKYIDLSKYCRQSSSYLFSYRHMAKTGKWPVVSPSDRRITAHCPDRLLRSYKRVPWRLQAAFDRYL